MYCNFSLNKKGTLKSKVSFKPANLHLFRNILGSNRHLVQNVLRQILGSIVVSIPACHAGDRGSIPRRGGLNILWTVFSVFLFLDL